MIKVKELKEKFDVNPCNLWSDLKKTYGDVKFLLFSKDVKGYRFPHKFLCSIAEHKVTKGKYCIVKFGGEKTEYVSNIDSLSHLINEYLDSLMFNSDSYYIQFKSYLNYYYFVSEYLDGLGFKKNRTLYNSDLFEYLIESSGLKISIEIRVSEESDEVGLVYSMPPNSCINLKSKFDIDELIGKINILLKPILLSSSSEMYDLYKKMEYIKDIDSNMNLINYSDIFDIKTSDYKEKLIEELEKSIKILRED